MKIKKKQIKIKTKVGKMNFHMTEWHSLSECIEIKIKLIFCFVYCIHIVELNISLQNEQRQMKKKPWNSLAT